MNVAYESTKDGFESNITRAFPTQQSLAFMESLTMPQVQELVISADLRCTECQKRIADIISRFNETETMVVNLSEKKVVITCKSLMKAPKKQIIKRQTNLFSMVALIERIFGSSRT
ncbi:uncharacterized protein LOC130807468 [Amaranthus tricolor]|uniref:uncharacterized protein LOC130807468 n=1 Tax=Amaranthus tricolor TaxID=29722 RepID=UPI00258C8761|nr:uncharacterized protein LOC130807468 [Amaranthus tricolor]